MEITVQKRDVLGKKLRALREQGLVPAELYGHGTENLHLSVPAKEFAKLYKEAGENTVINVVVDGKKIPALAYDVIINAISQKIEHVDFYAVKMDEKIITAIPLEFIGESMAVREGGILIKSMQEIEVEALPADLPHDIEVDLSKLENIHDSIHVKDLKISNKVKLLVEAETVVATVIEQAQEEVAAPVADVEDVKVEGEEKKKVKEEGKV